jgi:MFS family permease
MTDVIVLTLFSRSQAFKYYMAAVICLAMFMCNLVSAGPSVAIIETAVSFFPDRQKTSLVSAISTVAYGFSGASLLQGTSNIIWMPLVNKYGRRPVYILSFSVYFAATIWAAFTTSWKSYLAARIFIGFGSGAAETLVGSFLSPFKMISRALADTSYRRLLQLQMSSSSMREALLWGMIHHQTLSRGGSSLTKHTRFYTAALSCGVSGGMIIDG